MAEFKYSLSANTITRNEPFMRSVGTTKDPEMRPSAPVKRVSDLATSLPLGSCSFTVRAFPANGCDESGVRRVAIAA